MIELEEEARYGDPNVGRAWVVTQYDPNFTTVLIGVSSLFRIANSIRKKIIRTNIGLDKVHDSWMSKARFWLKAIKITEVLTETVLDPYVDLDLQ